MVVSSNQTRVETSDYSGTFCFVGSRFNALSMGAEYRAYLRDGMAGRRVLRVNLLRTAGRRWDREPVPTGDRLSLVKSIPLNEPIQAAGRFLLWVAESFTGADMELVETLSRRCRYVLLFENETLAFASDIFLTEGVHDVEDLRWFNALDAEREFELKPPAEFPNWESLLVKSAGRVHEVALRPAGRRVLKKLFRSGLVVSQNELQGELEIGTGIRNELKLIREDLAGLGCEWLKKSGTRNEPKWEFSIA